MWSSKFPGYEIFILDDDPMTVDLVRELLGGYGLEVKGWTDPKQFLKDMRNTDRPDLILLDIAMPGISGYEVCNKLKQEPETAHIPVIYLTALKDAEDRWKCFDSGGVDYVAKPFQHQELLARIDTHLGINKLQEELKSEREQLRQKVERQTSELRLARERLLCLDRKKSEFLKIISHELRTPMNIVLGVPELLFDEVEVSLGNNRLLEDFEESKNKILKIVSDVEYLSSVDFANVRYEPVSLVECLQSAAGIFRESWGFNGRLEELKAKKDLMVEGDPMLISNAMLRLFQGSAIISENSEFEPEVTEENGTIKVYWIIDTNLKAIDLNGLFEVFSVARLGYLGQETGLILPVASRILELFGAKINAGLDGGRGTKFEVSFPAYKEIEAEVR